MSGSGQATGGSVQPGKQRTARRFAKDGKTRCKRPCFTSQKAMFRVAKHGLLEAIPYHPERMEPDYLFLSGCKQRRQGSNTDRRGNAFRVYGQAAVTSLLRMKTLRARFKVMYKSTSAMNTVVLSATFSSRQLSTIYATAKATMHSNA